MFLKREVVLCHCIGDLATRGQSVLEDLQIVVSSTGR